MDDRKPMANIPPFGLRMQPNLKARVEEAARQNNRSLNAEIVARLQASFEGRPVEPLGREIVEIQTLTLDKLNALDQLIGDVSKIKDAIETMNMSNERDVRQLAL